MRILLSVIALIFGIQSFSKAEDIRDFELEGISLYESALNHFSENELRKDTVDNYTSNKYTTSNIFNKSDIVLFVTPGKYFFSPSTILYIGLF